VQGGTADTYYSVVRIGTWQDTSTPFSSSISAGSRQDNYIEATVHSISQFVPLSASELQGMRTQAKAVTLTASQSDPTHPVPGPFNGTHEVKIWFPERLIEKYPAQTRTVIEYPPMVGGTAYGYVPANDPGTHTFAISTTNTVESYGEVTLTGGVSGVIKAIGVKLDIGVRLGKKWSKTYGGSTTYSLGPNQPVSYKVRPKITWTHTDVPRLTATYGVNGYEGDTADKIVDAQKPMGILEWERTVVP
jgi:hypothetical protein